MNYAEPKIIAKDEWREILEVQEVCEAWGIPNNGNPDEFAGTIYGAKFDFHSGGPGYLGDIYILQGDVLSDNAPIILRRSSDKKLEVVA